MIAFALLNHPLVTGLLDAITFPDAKRTFTKDVLMRINLKRVANAAGWDGLTAFFANMDVESTPDEADFAAFLHRLTPAGSAQIQLELI